MDPQEERGLIDGCRAGSPGAFETLFNERREQSYRLAYRLTGSHADADDVLQHAWLRAFQGLRSFDGRSRFSTWFYQILVHSAADLGRRRSRGRSMLQPVSADKWEARKPEGDPVEQAQSNEFKKALNDAMRKLPRDLRAALALVAYEQMSYREAAEIQSVPEGTLAWRVSEARRRLAHKLAPFLT